MYKAKSDVDMQEKTQAHYVQKPCVSKHLNIYLSFRVCTSAM